jgi:hypothetical protein
MDGIKAITGILLITLSLCSLVCLFDPSITEDMIWFLIGTMFISSIFATLVIKSIKR